MTYIGIDRASLLLFLWFKLYCRYSWKLMHKKDWVALWSCQFPWIFALEGRQGTQECISTTIERERAGLMPIGKVRSGKGHPVFRLNLTRWTPRSSNPSIIKQANCYIIQLPSTKSMRWLPNNFCLWLQGILSILRREIWFKEPVLRTENTSFASVPKPTHIYQHQRLSDKRQEGESSQK